MSARILECSTLEYLNDPCPVPSLSQSIAHTLITRSPAHARLQHPQLGGRLRKPTKEMNTGSLIHSLILERGARIKIIDADDYRTKLAKEARDEAFEQGEIPVLRDAFEHVQFAAQAIRKNIAEFGIKLDGEAELKIAWEEEDGYGRPVLCRGMLDLFQRHGDRAIAFDLKTNETSAPSACTRKVMDFGYAIQHAAYTSALSKLYPELAGKIDFVFLFAEIEPPYAVTPARLDGGFRSIGESRWLRAVEIWSRCMRTKTWPAYATEVVTLEAPVWAMAAEAVGPSGESLL
jgi:hypothetical protein